MTAILSSEHGQLPLSPLDAPTSWFARLLFRTMKQRYGLVPMAYRVAVARFPYLGFVSLVIVIGLLRFLRVGHELAALIQISLAMRNGCTFCADLGLAEAARSRIGRERFSELLSFEDSASFSPREKAALAYTKALHESLHIPDRVWDELAVHYSERERVEIVWLGAVEQYFNAMALPLRIGSDQLAGSAPKAANCAPTQAGT